MKKLSIVIVMSVLLICGYSRLGNAQGTAATPPAAGDVQGSFAQLASTVQDLQYSLETIKSAIDANAHMIKTVGQNTDLRVGELEARIGSLEETLKIQGKQVTSAVSSVAPEAAKEADLYQSALNQINSSEFLKGVATLKKFLQQFPKSEYTGNAQYWIGECYFAMRDFEQAIKEFQILKDKYPRNEKIPAATLKQGYAFFELGMESDAKLFFNELQQKYPKTKEAREARDYLKREQELKAAEKAKPAQTGIPLAPGVEVPKEKEKAPTKYKD